MKTVFDIKPTRRGPATGNEKIHEFFAREGRPEVVPIRDWIEFWYSRLPSAKQPDIRGRLRSCDVHQLTAAYFELQMFALLRNMGYAVTVEPSLAAGHYNPDFLAQREDESFYLLAGVDGDGAPGGTGTASPGRGAAPWCTGSGVVEELGHLGGVVEQSMLAGEGGVHAARDLEPE